MSSRQWLIAAMTALLLAASGCEESSDNARSVTFGHDPYEGMVYYEPPEGEFTPEEYERAGWVRDEPNGWRPSSEDPRSHYTHSWGKISTNYPVHLPKPVTSEPWPGRDKAVAGKLYEFPDKASFVAFWNSPPLPEQKLIVPQDKRQKVELLEIVPCFVKDTVGVKMISAAMIGPKPQHPGQIIDARVSLKLTGTLANAKVVGCVVEEMNGGITVKRMEAFYNQPSQCNDYCQGETRYSMSNIGSRCIFRATWILVQGEPATGEAKADMHVNYEFVEPYKEHKK